MEKEALFVYLMKVFFAITSPVTFIVGLFLIFDVRTYVKMEKFLSTGYGLKRILVHQIEKNRESLQLFLLKRRHFVGAVCLLNSLMAVVVVLFLIKI